MKSYRTKLPVFVVAAVLMLLSAAVTFAQNTGTVIFTEAQINETYRVTNPLRSSLTNVSVDLKAGAVDIYATHTSRRAGTTVDTVTELAPAVSADGSIDWTVLSIVTTSGETVSDEIIASVNTSIANSWANYWRGRTFRYAMTGVLVTEDSVSFDYVTTGAERPVQPTVVAGDGVVSLSYTESELNDAYVVTTPRRQTLSDMYVDLQPGQVVISATFTPALRGEPIETVTTLVPEIDNGQITWTVIAISADGQPASGATLTQINNAIVNSWLAHWRQNLGPNALTGVVILDDSITFSYSA